MKRIIRPSPMTAAEHAARDRACESFIECLFSQRDAGGDPAVITGGLALAFGEIMRRTMTPAEAAAWLRLQADEIEEKGWTQAGEFRLG